MLEKTLVLIKPDGVERNLIGTILNAYETNNLKISDFKFINASTDIAKEHYIEHKTKPFFNDIITYLTRSKLVALVLEGDDAIQKVRDINGCTNPILAKKGTIRNSLALSEKPNENLVHASDSKESAEREISLWF